MLEIRKVRPDEFDEMMKLHFYAFQYRLTGEDYERRRMLYAKQNIWGCYEDGKIVSKVQTRPFKISLGEQRIDMGGVLGIATYPEYRRKGMVKELLKCSLSEMRDFGQIVSILHPFSYDFYRKFGWEMLSGTQIIKLNVSDLRMRIPKEQGSIIRYTGNDFNDDLNTVYDKYSSNFAGMVVRDEDWWKHHVISDSTAAVYYDESNKPTGYMIYKVQDFNMTVSEFTVLTPEARLALYNYICQHDSMVRQIQIQISPNDPLMFSYINPKSEISKRYFGMIRVVDVEAFLKIYPFKKENLSGSVKFLITDEHAPWNNGEFSIGEGSPELSIKLDINKFSALVFNVISPKFLFDEGITGKEDTDVLTDIMPDFKPFLQDYF